MKRKRKENRDVKKSSEKNLRVFYFPTRSAVEKRKAKMI
nr:MAG TPA: hypothetical protein [Caudoviricetes sp.]